jgi:hypothetical protein
VPARYDHVRPTAVDHPDGVYRVVGVDESGVTLLRVASPDGRRVHTGELVRVDGREFDGFAPAENPDGNRPLGAAVASALSLGYWSVRAFGTELAAHPPATAVAFGLLLAGAFGGRVVTLPNPAFGWMVLVGSLWLAYVGSGRL